MNYICTITLSDFVKSFGPVITACATLIVFYLTTRRDKKKERKKAKKERLNKLKHFIYVSSEAINTVEKQAKALSTHLDDVKEQKFYAIALSYYNKRSCELLIDLISNESTFVAVTTQSSNVDLDVILTYSKISAKSIFLNHLLDAVIKSVKENFDYINSQTKLIQSEVDELLKSINKLSISLQRDGFVVQEDADFVNSIKELNITLYGQDDQGLETFYNYLILPLEMVISHCKIITFSDIDGLLVIARFRDRAYRMYMELFRTHEFYMKRLNEEANRLQSECEELKDLIKIIRPNNSTP